MLKGRSLVNLRRFLMEVSGVNATKTSLSHNFFCVILIHIHCCSTESPSLWRLWSNPDCARIVIYTYQIKLLWSATGMGVVHATTRLIMVKFNKKLHFKKVRKTRSETKRMNSKMIALSWTSSTYCKIILLWKRTSSWMIRTIWTDIEIALPGKSGLQHTAWFYFA